MTNKLHGTDTLEAFRAAVLEALDEKACELFGSHTTGWNDQDLPELFRAIDRHTMLLACRFNVELTEV